MLMGVYTAVIVIHDVFLFCCSFVLFCVLVLQVVRYLWNL